MNSVHEYFSKAFNMFTWISTMIFIFSGIFIALFWGSHTQLGLSYVFGVLVMSAVFSLVGTPVMNMEKAGKKKMALFQALYFLFVNMGVVATGFFLNWFTTENKAMVAGFEVTIIFVYGMLTVIMNVNDRKTANRMNERLKNLREN